MSTSATQTGDTLVHWQSPRLQAEWLRANQDARVIRDVLAQNGALDFPTYESGLTPASALSGELGTETGMGFAWVRDNCYAAYALLLAGDQAKASGVVRALLRIFATYEHMLDAVITGAADPNDIMTRPPARVVGDTLGLTGNWSNAQNDSIGYTLWVVAEFVQHGALQLTAEDWDIITKLARYLNTIEYWHDADNGHWEEDRQLHAASIGAVVAGLSAVSDIAPATLDWGLDLDQLITDGRTALNQSLIDVPLDASVLFLVEPLRIVTADQTARIIAMVEQNLRREIGIIRYPNDSYWAADYRDHFGLGDRTADFSDRMDERAKFSLEGHEAQWTIFDPMLSCYYSRRYAETNDEQYLQKSRYYLERSLASYEEREGKWLVPEAYFFEHGQWVANDHVPLLWSQANLIAALRAIEDQ